MGGSAITGPPQSLKIEGKRNATWVLLVYHVSVVVEMAMTKIYLEKVRLAFGCSFRNGTHLPFVGYNM